MATNKVTHKHTHILVNGVKCGVGASTSQSFQSNADLSQVPTQYTRLYADTLTQTCSKQYLTHTKLQIHTAEQTAVAHQSTDTQRRTN